MLATPRTRRALAGGPMTSMVRATFGRSASALTFGAVGAVQTTMSVPVHQNPIGITRGNPSGPAYASRAGSGDWSRASAAGCWRSSRARTFVIRAPTGSLDHRPLQLPRHRLAAHAPLSRFAMLRLDRV